VFVRVWIAVLLSVVVGCAAAKEFVALRQVEFRYDRVSDARVAGIALGQVRSPEDVSPLDLARLGIAIASKDVPLDVTVHIEGRNPETNDVTARLVALDWAYLVDGRETVSGRLAEPFAFPPGQPTDVPVLVTFNLVDFFGGDGRALLDIALALGGQRASTHAVTLRLTPTVDTPAGPIRYPAPLTLDLSGPRTR
jgi:hypothetical protein